MTGHANEDGTKPYVRVDSDEYHNPGKGHLALLLTI